MTKLETSAALRYGTVLETAPFPVVGLRVDQQIDFWNDAAADFFAIAASAALGRKLGDVLPLPPSQDWQTQLQSGRREWSQIDVHFNTGNWGAHLRHYKDFYCAVQPSELGCLRV